MQINPDKWFADSKQGTIRQHSRLVQDMKPIVEEYEKAKVVLGDAFYAEKNTAVHGLQ